MGRTNSHRKAMMANMATSLILHKRIKTTLAKAKALRGYVEPIITKSKEDSTHQRRMVFSYLKDKEATKILFADIAPKIATRPGGYTRILKTGFRQGDAAEMCFIELVDFNDNYSMNKGATAAAGAKKTRRAGGAKKADASTATQSAPSSTSTAPAVETGVDAAGVADSSAAQ